MNGIIVVDKPEGFSSFDAVSVVRRLAHEKKAGHTGTLDPMATGVLPMLLGRAAKALNYLPDTDKEYRAGFRMGEKRDTGDITGEIIAEDGVYVKKEELEKKLAAFRGEIMQVPPMYSAVSVNGERLYKLARKGIEIEREARKVNISGLTLLQYDEEKREGVLLVSCSKGTYIRALIEDIAESLCTVGTMTSLRRTRACGFCEDEAVGIDTLRAAGSVEKFLVPIEKIFEIYSRVQVSAAQKRRFSNGGGLSLERVKITGGEINDGSLVRLCFEDEFLGLGRVSLSTGEISFEKLFTGD